MRALVVALLVALGPSVARAEMVPGFNPEGVCWNADRIVVATQKAGNYKVTEVWRGSARVGEEIALGIAAAPTDHATARAVLFLRGVDQPASDWGGMGVSMAWIDGGEVFVLLEDRMRGVEGVSRIGMKEPAFKALVTGFLSDRDNFARASLVADPRIRVAQLRPLAESRSFRLRRVAIDALGKSGVDAVPVLHALIADDTRDPSNAVDALAAVAVDRAAELLAIVREELLFWQRVAPGLKKDWWNDGRPQTERLRNHYVKLVMALRQLVPVRSPSSRAPVMQLRDFWRSNPVLEDKSGLDQMSRTADEVLKALS
jgi:hypothetical protein